MIHAERRDESFLLYRDAEGRLQTTALAGEFTVGRNAGGTVHPLGRPGSGLHAELKELGGELTLVDDGLSRNGSYVNGERVDGRRRLRDGDRLQFGRNGRARAPAHRWRASGHRGRHQGRFGLALSTPRPVSARSSPPSADRCSRATRSRRRRPTARSPRSSSCRSRRSNSIFARCLTSSGWATSRRTKSGSRSSVVPVPAGSCPTASPPAEQHQLGPGPRRRQRSRPA